MVLSQPLLAPAQTGRTVTLIDQTGTVDPLSARYVQRGIRQAELSGAEAVLVRIDTPGGLDSSMRTIIKAIQGARLPVVCWVGPSGARAASAGAFILLSCPVAAMAPGTNVGAAHPVGFSGEVLSEKITNDAAAYIRALAEQRGRNADWAEKAVRESVSITAREALELKVIDLISPSTRALMSTVNGRAVVLGNGTRVLLDTAGASIDRIGMSFSESLFHGVIDPNLAFLFLVIGFAGIVYEVLNPGLNIAGVVGLILLIAAFVMFGMLPVNIAGLVLVLAGLGFFVLDFQIAGHGLPTFAGIVSLVLGGLFLFNAEVPNARVSKGLIVGIAVSMGLFFYFVVRAVVTARRQRPATGEESLVGAIGTVVVPLDPQGMVRARGEEWTARTAGERVPAGAEVRVTAVNGLTLEVEPVSRDQQASTTT
jgi:membrane-bound serine protease (ClpP class)